MHICYLSIDLCLCIVSLVMSSFECVSVFLGDKQSTLDGRRYTFIGHVNMFLT